MTGRRSTKRPMSLRNSKLNQKQDRKSTDSKENLKVSEKEDGLKQETKENQRNYSLDEFCNLIREKCVLSERWVVRDPVVDPSVKQSVILVVEVDVTFEGELRVKRCVKLFEDRSFRVLIDNVDMTHMFDLNKKIYTTTEVDKLLYSVLMKKVCQGLKTYDAETGPPNLPVKQRGKIWYSKECTILVQKVFMGNSCAPCGRIRNQIKRSFQTDRRKHVNRPQMKQVKSTFGKALYSLLNDLSGRGPIPHSQYPRDHMVYDEKLEIYISNELQNRLITAASMPPPPPPQAKSRSGSRKNRRSSAKGNNHFQPSATITSASGQAIPVQEMITEDGQVCYVTNMMDSNVVAGMGDPIQWSQVVIEKCEPPEMDELVMNEHGNIIIQNIQGQEFSLTEGQEYELIGEAQPTIDPIEILPADNQQIQIIEVDDATMEQIEVHGSMDNMQIASVDPNDPNLSSLLRAFQAQVQGLAL